jgi:multidrug efflux pump subunit AcrA (membrane-fusion protein)
VRREGDRDVVYLVHDDRVERRAVRVGAMADDTAEIVAGLAAGEQVVVDGPERLATGQRVVVR